MAKQLRVEYPGATYQVMSRSNGRFATYRDDEDRRFFLELVQHPVDKGELIVHAFALMWDRFHLLAETPSGNLSRIMHRILGMHAQRFNRRHDWAGPIWEAGYKAIVVEDGPCFLQCSRYIHLSPCSGNPAHPHRPRWSSYRNYVSGPTAVDWISTDRTLSLLEDAEDYRDYLKSAGAAQLENPFDCATAGLVLGGETFVLRIRSLVLQKGDSQVNRTGFAKLCRTERTAPIAAIRKAVSTNFGDLPPELKKRVLMFALDQCTWLKRTEIARVIGCTPAAVTPTVGGISRLIARDAQFSERFDRLLVELHRSP